MADRGARQLAMGSAAGRCGFLAALLLPSGIIRPAMRIIAARADARSPSGPSVRSFVRSRASNITARHATRIRRT